MIAEPGSGPLTVVLVHRYFVPDTPPYATILHHIAAALSAAGHQVTVLTCQPSYNRAVVGSAPARESLDGYDVVRWPVLDDRRSTALKVLNLLWFSTRIVLARSTFRSADVVMAATTPPVVLAKVCSWMARRSGAAFVYHKQDIYPEVSGKPNGMPRRGLARALRTLDARTDAAADRVVVLSEDMARTTRARSGATRTTVLNNFDPWTIDGARLEGVSPAGGLRLVFAGNLGRFQGLEAVMDLIRETAADAGIEWHFFGNGPLRGEIDALAASSEAHVVVHGYQSPEVVATFVASQADLGIVSLNPGVIESAFPSKTLTYLRNGCPVLTLVERDSELARMVEGERIGIAGEPQDVESIAARLRQLAADRSLLPAARERAAQVYEERFSVERQLARWVELVEDVAR